MIFCLDLFYTVRYAFYNDLNSQNPLNYLVPSVYFNYYDYYFHYWMYCHYSWIFGKATWWNFLYSMNFIIFSCFLIHLHFPEYFDLVEVLSWRLIGRNNRFWYHCVPLQSISLIFWNWAKGVKQLARSRSKDYFCFFEFDTMCGTRLNFFPSLWLLSSQIHEHSPVLRTQKYANLSDACDLSTSTILRDTFLSVIHLNLNTKKRIPQFMITFCYYYKPKIRIFVWFI